MSGWVGPVASYMAIGFRTTVELAAVSVVCSVVVGVVLGIVYTLPAPPVRWLVRAYIELWRGLPLIVTLFFIFFALPIFGLKFGLFVSAAIGLSLWGSAQVAETTRGAVQSIPPGQQEGAFALGLTWVQTRVYVIFPQALRRLLPPVVSLLTNLIQNSTLGSVIGLLGVLEAGQRSIQRLTTLQGTTHAVGILGSILVVFFVICFPLTRLSSYMERKAGTGTQSRGPRTVRRGRSPVQSHRRASAPVG